MTIHTDSLSSKQAIESALRAPERFKALRCASRPYLLAITTADVIRTTPRHHVALRTLHSTLSVTQPVLMLFFIGQNFPDA